MAADVAGELPEGFVLDQPPAAGNAGLPPDFQLDPPQEQGVPTSFLQGVNKAVANVATAPFQGIHAAAEGAKRMRESGRMGEGDLVPDAVAEAYGHLGGAELINRYLPKAWYSGAYLEPPEPGTTAEKFARSMGENVGYSVLPEAGLVGKAEKLAKVAPTTAPRALVQQIGEQYATKPARAVIGSTAAAGASGAGQEAAREAELGPGWEIAAGAATPAAMVAAPVTTVRTARALLRIPPDAFTPTVARWKTDADAIFRKLGIPMSADGSGAGETAGGQAAAYMTLANALRRANVPVEQLDTMLERIAYNRRFYSNSYAPDVTALVDLDPALQKFAGSVMRENPEVWRRAVDFMYGRQTGVTPYRSAAEQMAGMGIPTRDRYAPPITGEQAQSAYGTKFGVPDESVVPMGERERVGDAFKRALKIEDVDFHGHAATSDMTDAQLVQLAQDASKTKYDAMRAAGQGVDLRPTIEPILQRWEAALQGVGTSQVRAQIKKNIGEIRTAINIPDEEIPSLVRGTSSPVERLDNWKKFLDQDIGKFYSGDKTHNKIIGNALQEFKKSIFEGLKDPQTGNVAFPGVDYVDTNNLGQLYADARATFSSVADARRALQTGRDIWSGKAGLDEFHALEGDDASQKLVRLGMHGGYMQDTANMARGHDVTRLFDKPRLDEVLSEMIPRSQGNGVFSDTPQRFGRYQDYEQMMQGTAKRTYQGSPTAERIADDKAAKELFDLPDQIRQGGIKNVLSNYAADIMNKFFGYRADTAATIGRVLFTADPTQRAQAIYQIRQYMGPDRFTYFQKLMGAQAKRFAESAGVSAPGATTNQPTGQTP